MDALCEELDTYVSQFGIGEVLDVVKQVCVKREQSARSIYDNPNLSQQWGKVASAIDRVAKSQAVYHVDR